VNSVSELQRLTDLARAACQCPPDSRERKRALNQLVREIQKSGKLWHESSDIYDEALSRTWLYFSKNLCECEARTAKQAFNPELASVTHWLNVYLKRRLQDLRTEKMNDRRQRVWLQAFLDPENPNDPIMNLPDTREDIPPVLEMTIAWLDSNTQLDEIHVKGRPDITARLLIRKRLPPETSWKEIGAEVDYSSQLLAAFYHRRCLPLLREFGKSEGLFDG
jgi:hypothetical protein